MRGRRTCWISGVVSTKHTHLRNCGSPALFQRGSLYLAANAHSSRSRHGHDQFSMVIFPFRLPACNRPPAANRAVYAFSAVLEARLAGFASRRHRCQHILNCHRNRARTHQQPTWCQWMTCGATRYPSLCHVCLRPCTAGVDFSGPHHSRGRYLWLEVRL